MTHLAVSHSQDEYTVLTADDSGVIRVNKINMRQRRLTKDQKKNLKSSVKEKRHCKVEHTFPKGATHAPLDLASIKGYTIALERGVDGDSSSILALNMSHVGKRKDALSAAPSPVVWRRQQEVRDWSVHKRFQAGDVVALLSEDGLKIEVLELLMQVYTAPSSTDSFGNFKMPMIGVAVLLVLGYQYMRQKGKGGGGGGGGKGGKFDMAAFSKKSKGGLGGALSGLAGLKNKGRGRR